MPGIMQGDGATRCLLYGSCHGEVLDYGDPFFS